MSLSNACLKFKYGKKLVTVYRFTETEINAVFIRHKRCQDSVELDHGPIFDAICLYLKQPNYAGMTIEEFVNKMVPRPVYGKSQNKRS